MVGSAIFALHSTRPLKTVVVVEKMYKPGIVEEIDLGVLITLLLEFFSTSLS